MVLISSNLVRISAYFLRRSMCLARTATCSSVLAFPVWKVEVLEQAYRDIKLDLETKKSSDFRVGTIDRATYGGYQRRLHVGDVVSAESWLLA